MSFDLENNKNKTEKKLSQNYNLANLSSRADLKYQMKSKWAEACFPRKLAS